MKSSPTLRDLAAHVGVSIYSVSLALRGASQVSPALRERVTAAASELGYRPNPTIAALMRSIRAKSGVPRLTTLALVVPLRKPDWLGKHRYMAEIAEGVKARCATLGFGYEQFITPFDRPISGSMGRVIKARGVDGVIIGPQYESDLEIELDFPNLAYVAVGLTFNQVAAHRVTTTTLLNIRHALEHTLALGWSRPGIMLTDRDNDLVENMMLGAYLGFLHRRIERPPAPFIFKESEFTKENVLAWVRREGVNAVLCSRAIVATWMREAGINVGKDVAFALLDRPRQSTEFAGVVQQLDHVGGAAVAVLGELIHSNQRGVPETPRVVEVEGVWQDGPSMPLYPGFACERRSLITA